MTEPPTPAIPEGRFRIADLADEARRTAITRLLDGVRWEMLVRPDYKPGKKYGFLTHAAFPDAVFFHLNTLQLPPNSEQCIPGGVLSVEVEPRFNHTKKRWGFATKAGGERVSLPAEPSPTASAPGTDAAEKEQEPPTNLQRHLRKIRFFASWGNGAGNRDASHLSAQCLDLDPTSQSLIDQAILNGQEDGRLLEPFYSLGRRLGTAFAEDAVFQQALQKLEQQGPALVERAQKQAAKGAAAAARDREAKNLERQGLNITNIRAPQGRAPMASPLPAPSQTPLPARAPTADLHPRDVRALSPRPAWRLLIDETGIQFGLAANQLSPADRELGRVLGLLIPRNGSGLEPLSRGWHAVDQSIGEIDRVIQAILDAPVGVIGITVQQLPDAAGERWAFGVIRLLDLVLRLLPIDGPTRLEVLIEQRGHDFKGGTQWPAVAEQARLRLAEAYPERGRWIELQVRAIRKTDSPFNGYVDALAFIASASAAHSRACLAAAGLAGTCLLGGDAETLTRAMDWLDRGRTLDGRDWTLLLAQPDAEQSVSLVGTLLARLGEAAQADTTLWRRYLEQVMGHLDSRSLDLPMLGRQVIWLQRWAPADQPLPPTLRLLWLTAQLARANHLGLTEQHWIKEMHTLADQLMDEDARLVCRAELNLAVAATNYYDFAQANRALQRWNPLGTQPAVTVRGLLQTPRGTQPPAPGALATPKATAGLRYWGQVRSSLGQHAAFTGDHAAARCFFDEALENFDRLSDPEQARRDRQQTQTYRAIALMDDPAQDTATVRRAVEAVTGPLPDALATLAGSVASADKYAHHLALRWLTHRPDPTLVAVYLARREVWDQGVGHPWPLIALYRGMLLYSQDPPTALDLALDGALAAFTADSGPVVRLIGACCRAIAARWGQPWPGAQPMLETLARDLPLAAARIEHVRVYLNRPAEPLELLRAVLPFNFR